MIVPTGRILAVALGGLVWALTSLPLGIVVTIVAYIISVRSEGVQVEPEKEVEPKKPGKMENDLTVDVSKGKIETKDENEKYTPTALSPGTQLRDREGNVVPGIRIRDQKDVRRKIEAAKAGGIKSLHVVADFDQTLSSYYRKPGHRNYTCHRVMNMALPPEYEAESGKLYHKYYPIEIDPNMTQAEKIKAGLPNWWHTAHKQMVQFGLKKDKLVEGVEKANILLREGTTELLRTLNEHNVPVLVMSAGIADVVDEVLVLNKVSSPNQTTISNKIAWDENGKITGMASELIYTYNKNASSETARTYWDQHKARRNIILLGDSIGDLKMTAGCDEDMNVLRIGFCNVKEQERLPEFVEKFDVVITGDGPMDYVLDIIKEIL